MAYFNGKKVQLNADLSGGDLPLPALENPATAEEIVQGYEAYDKDGNPIEGTYEGGGLDPLTNPATADKIFDGYEAYGDDGEVIEGTFVLTGMGAETKTYGMSHANCELDLTGIFTSYAN